MAGIFIDPAESFSKALGQGLSTIKSFRDEERMDQDRAFEKSMKLEAQRQAQEQLNLLIGKDKREQAVFDEDMTPERVALRSRKAVADVNLAEADALDKSILASRRGEMIDTDIQTAKSNARANLISAGASSRNAATNAAELGLRTRMYNDERADRVAANQLRIGFQAISAAGRDPTPDNMRALMGNKVAGSALIKLASNAFNAPVLEEIMQNPFGNWINDGKKLAVALRFARDTEVVNATAKAQGFNPTRTTVTNIRGATVKDSQGRPQQVVQLTLRGPDARTGKTKTYTGYAQPSRLFETGAVAANVFKGIMTDPVAKGRVAQMFEQTNPDAFYKILNYEASRIEKELKTPTDSRVVSGEIPVEAYNAALQKRLAALENGDPNLTSDVVFKYMGRMGS